MKTLFVSLAALVAVSGAALAAGGDDLRSSDTYFGKYATQNKAGSYSNTDSSISAFAVSGNGGSLTAYERMMQISEDNEHGSDSQPHDTRDNVKK